MTKHKVERRSFLLTSLTSSCSLWGGLPSDVPIGSSGSWKAMSGSTMAGCRMVVGATICSFPIVRLWANHTTALSLSFSHLSSGSDNSLPTSPFSFFLSFFFYSVYAAKSLQSCLTLWDPIDSSPPGSPAPRILQARTLEWVAIAFSVFCV